MIASILIYTMLHMFVVVMASDTGRHNEVYEHRGKNYNLPNSKLEGLSKHGREVENRLYESVKNKELGWHRVGEHRVAELRHRMAIAQAGRNHAKQSELDTRKELKEKGRSLNSIKYHLRSADCTTTESCHKYALNNKAKNKEIIRKIVSDANIHLKHGNMNEDDVSRVTTYNWHDSEALGYNHDGRITSKPGYRSRSPSPPPSRSSSPSP